MTTMAIITTSKGSKSPEIEKVVDIRMRKFRKFSEYLNSL
jgi:hypothetical protein